MMIIIKELCLLSHASTTCDRAMGGTLCNAVHKVFDTSQGIWDVIYQIHFYFLVNTNYCLLVRMLSIMNTKYSISFPFVCRLHWIFQFSRFSDLISDITQAYLPWKETKSKFMNIYWSQLKYELSFKHTKWGQKKERCGNILGLLSYISYCSSL